MRRCISVCLVCLFFHQDVSATDLAWKCSQIVSLDLSFTSGPEDRALGRNSAGEGPSDFEIVDDEIFVLDSRNYVVKVFDRSGKLLRWFPKPVSLGGTPILKNPVRIFAVSGKAFVLDVFGGRPVLHRFDMAGTHEAEHRLSPGNTNMEVVPEASFTDSGRIVFLVKGEWKTAVFDPVSGGIEVHAIPQGAKLRPVQIGPENAVIVGIETPQDPLSGLFVATNTLREPRHAIPRDRIVLKGYLLELDPVSSSMTIVDRYGRSLGEWKLPFQYGSPFAVDARYCGNEVYVTARAGTNSVEIWQLTISAGSEERE